MMKVPAVKNYYLNDEGANCQELLFKIVMKIGSIKPSCMEVRGNITSLIVVGEKLLFNIIEKTGSIMFGSKGQNHPLNSSWCKLPEFISDRES